MVGRPAKPTAALKREGTYDASRHSDRRDMHYGGNPIPPSGLTAHGQFIWDLIIRATPPNIIKEIDTAALIAACELWSTWKELMDIVREDPAQNWRELRSALAAWKEFQRIASEFGMSPVARCRIRDNSQGELPSDPLALLAENRN